MHLCGRSPRSFLSLFLFEVSSEDQSVCREREVETRGRERRGIQWVRSSVVPCGDDWRCDCLHGGRSARRWSPSLSPWSFSSSFVLQSLGLDVAGHAPASGQSQDGVVDGGHLHGQRDGVLVLGVRRVLLLCW